MACTPFCKDEPPTTGPEAQFERFWADVRITYPFFELDGVDWQATYNRYRPHVSASTSDDSLFAIFSAMMEPLADGHASLVSPTGKVWVSKTRRRFPADFSLGNILLAHSQDTADYLKKQFVSFQITEGVLYAFIRDFETAGIADSLERALHKATYRGLILDLRRNPGGLVAEAEMMAGLFTPTAIQIGTEKYKNGVLPTDFTSPEARIVQPYHGFNYQGKVALLTNRYSASSSERFRFAAMVLPQFTTLGDTTFGATSPIIERGLPGGWKYVLTGSVNYDHQGRLWERRGIPPDIHYTNTTADLHAKKDNVLEAALGLF